MTRYIVRAAPMGRPIYLRRGRWVTDLEKATHYQSRYSAELSLATATVRDKWARHAEAIIVDERPRNA